jgi:hypothetical protein
VASDFGFDTSYAMKVLVGVQAPESSHFENATARETIDYYEVREYGRA